MEEFEVVRAGLREDSGVNPRSYYSGHYNQFGLDVQAVYDAGCCFVAFIVVAPGKPPDQVEFERTALYDDLVQKLPFGLYRVADAAYALTDQVLVPFTGSQRHDIDNDAYNYFLSQLGIHIKMSFGLLTSKFRILRCNLATTLSVTAIVLECCARLHNFVIDEDWDNKIDDDDIFPRPKSPNGEWGYHLPTVEDFDPIPGTLQMRDIILERVSKETLRRPGHNEERRRQELYEQGLM